MTAKLGWEKSTSGPDWMDVIGQMNALNVLHSGRVELIVSLGGTGFATYAQLKAVMRFETLPGSQLPKEVEVIGKYPDSVSKTYCGYVFRLLIELDYQISQVYKTEGLWK